MLRCAFFALGLLTVVLGTGAAALYLMPARSLGLAARLVAERAFRLEEGIPFGPTERHRLDVYRPPSGGTGGPVVLFIYGGGWRSGERSMYRFVGAALASRGFTTVIPDYRLFPEAPFPGFVEDAARAYAWTARNLGRSCGPVVMGHSAGAYIAAMLALDRRYLDAAAPDLKRPSALVGLAGPYSFDPTTWPTTRDIFANARSADEARPISFADGRAPPALLFHGTGDTIVRPWNSQNLHKALTESRVASDLRELDGKGHFTALLALAWPLRWLGDVYEPVIGFIRQHGQCG